ncbi:conserved phage C-terminal domain-containing protein [Loigolactobacillus jiayinensis]|uniref:Conserved phage C-terminal domain-containing protein n=1 Tax=Loigolactobacillus jiayinensis TaxID=2486016 RepID=A0ABW1RGE9_9LACO|nr:conserved phage C-terminal domain-containing protein [Loigolactobacillus jiayinensis]
MTPLFLLPSNFYEQPEFKQLHHLASSHQELACITLWVRSLSCAAHLQANGTIAFNSEQPLTLMDFAQWLSLGRTARILPLLNLLSKCDLIKKTANGHYHICHWERYLVPTELAANYDGLVKFSIAGKQPPATATPLTLPARVAPLALQYYTPEQRKRLAASTKKILAYLQQQSGKAFTPTESVQILLADLFSQKVTMKQIKQVIDWKIQDWRDSDYWKFVRPQTLFGPKFKQYLLEAPPLPQPHHTKGQTREEYLRILFNVCSGDIELAIRRAADDAVTTDRTEMEVIGHALGH